MTLPSQTAPSTLLSPSSYAVVSATAPVVAQHADEITARFYANMFAAHPELLRVFNQGNQATGEQSKALAASVVAYAVQLIDPNAPSFAHVMRRIAYKHMSLGIRAEQYIVVGHHLLEAVAQILGEAVTPDVAAAWEEVYWLFAVELIAEEARLYQHASIDPAHPTRPYRVVKTIEETPDVISLVLEPADGRPLPEIAPGQYVSVFVDLPDGDRQPRQYTVSSTAVGTRLQITVRRVLGKNGAPNGRVSSYLHDRAKAGDILEVSAPAGDLVLTPSDSPLLLASAGAGITTVLPIVEHIVRTQPRRPVIVAHADRTAQDHALRQTVQRIGHQLDNFTSYTWYEHVDPATRAPGKATWIYRTFHCLMTSTSSPADRWPSCTMFAQSLCSGACRRTTSATKYSARISGPRRETVFKPFAASLPNGSPVPAARPRDLHANSCLLTGAGWKVPLRSIVTATGGDA